MFAWTTSACAAILLASAAFSQQAGSAGDAAAEQRSPFDSPPPAEPRIYSLDELYAERPTEAVTVAFRVLSVGTHYTERYARIDDAKSRPIILDSTKNTGAEPGDYFKVALVSDASAAVENLGLDPSFFKNRRVKASGFVQRVKERWGVGPRVRYEIVVDDLKFLEVVPERLTSEEH